MTEIERFTITCDFDWDAGVSNNLSSKVGETHSVSFYNSVHANLPNAVIFEERKEKYFVEMNSWTPEWTRTESTVWEFKPEKIGSYTVSFY